MGALRTAVLVLAALAIAGRADAAVELRDGRLTVRVEEAALADVLHDVARLSGAEVRGRVDGERRVTVDLERVPVRQALERLLGEHNFALTYGEDGRLRVIELLGDGPPAPPRAAARGDEPPEGLTRAGEVLDRFARSDRPLRVGRRLAEALGTERPTFMQVSQAALSSDDAGVRARAFRVTLQAIEDDPTVRAAFAFALARAEDRGVAEFLRRNAGPNAEEVVERLARSAETPAVREKAATVLEQLRAE